MTPALIAAALVAVSHALRVRYGLNPGDEGFLWNGTLRIGQGRIPIRDYKCYDPFRFYWNWAWMRLFGDGILGLRHAVALFQFLGLWAGLVSLAKVTANPLALALAGAVLVLWMHPRHKLFEHAMSLIAVLAVATLLQSPEPRTAFTAGLVTGFAGFVGRNHIAYTLGAVVLAFGLLALRGEGPGPAALLWPWVLGGVVGYAPMLGMFIFIPGMFRTYIYQKVLVFLGRKRSDIARPAPLPWRQDFRGLSLADRLSQLLIGLYFLAMPVFGIGGTLWAAASPAGLSNPTFAAAALVGLFYMHHAAARSDLAHLCQATQPLLCGLLALAYGAQSPLLFWSIPVAMLATAWLVARKIDPRIQALEAQDAFTETDLLGERLFIQRGTAAMIGRVQALADRHIAPQDTVFIAPRMPAYYPILKKQTPVRSDYMLFPEDPPAQARIIADLEGSNTVWALIHLDPRDGRDELRFKHTHAKVWDYLERNFEPVGDHGLGPKWIFWRRNCKKAAA